MSLFRDLYAARAPMAGFCAIGLVWGSFAALIPDLKAQVGLGDAAFGTAMLAAASGTLCALWLSPLADQRLDRRAMPVLIVCLALTVLAPGQAVGWLSFALAMGAVSMLSGSADVVFNARIGGIEARSDRPLMNMAHGMFSMVYACAALITGAMRELGGPPALIFALVCLAVLVCAWVSTRDDVGAQRAEDPTRARPVPLNRRVLIWGGLILMVAFMAEQATEGWAALHLERGLGASPSGGALGPALLGLTMAAGRFSGQWLIRHLTEPRLIALACLLSGSGALLAAFAPSSLEAYIGFGILGLGVSVVVPMTYAWVSRVVTPEARTRAIAQTSVLGYVGFFIGPALMGSLSDLSGLHLSFTMIALTLWSVSLLFVPLLKTADPTARN